MPEGPWCKRFSGMTVFGGRLRHRAHPRRFLLAALPSASQVVVLDLSSMEVAHTVSCDASGQVAEIDLVGWKVTRFIAAGGMGDGLAWAMQP